MFEREAFRFLMQSHGVTPVSVRTRFLRVPQLALSCKVLTLVSDCDFQILQVYFTSEYLPKLQPGWIGLRWLSESIGREPRSPFWSVQNRLRRCGGEHLFPFRILGIKEKIPVKIRRKRNVNDAWEKKHGLIKPHLPFKCTYLYLPSNPRRNTTVLFAFQFVIK